MRDVFYQTEPGVRVLVQEQRPAGAVAGEVVMVHGLEGSGQAGYMRSMAQAALEAGFGAQRFNMRTCGGTGTSCNTLYHAGLTCDLLAVLRHLQEQGRTPVYLVGYSLGGNVVLKLAGELGEDARKLISGVAAISTPLDLAACTRQIGHPDNRIYQRGFVRRMRARLQAMGRYSRQELKRARSIFQFDDLFTAPSFGFRGAEHYYETQSASRFLDRIRVPALLIQAKDDMFIPFVCFRQPAFETNPHLRLIATEHGGHLGFLSRRRPRFWADVVVIEWIRNTSKMHSEAPLFERTQQ